MSYCFKNNYFGRNMHKDMLYLLKNFKNRSALEAPPPDPVASGGSTPNGLRPSANLSPIENSWLRHCYQGQWRS